MALRTACKTDAYCVVLTQEFCYKCNASEIASMALETAEWCNYQVPFRSNASLYPGMFLFTPVQKLGRHAASFKGILKKTLGSYNLLTRMNECTDIRRLMRPHLVEAEPYAAIDPPEVLARMAGIPEEQIIKLDGNENLYGASPGVQQALASCRTYHIYPDPQQRRVRHALAEYAGTTPDRVVAGAGSDELIDLLLRLFVGPGDRVIQSVPTFAMYATFTHLVGGTMVSVPRDETFDLDLEAIGREARQGAKVLFLTSPNNPTGNLVSQETVQESLKMGLVVVVDEAYYEFAGSTVASLVPEHNNLVVLRSFSKWAGLAGLRIGYGLMDPAVAERLLVIKPPYNITVASEIALLASLQDRELLLSRVKSLVEERDRLFVELGRFPQLTPVPSSANFILCRLRQGKGRSLYGELARRGIFVRYYDTPLLRDYIRVSVGLAHHNRALVSALQAILGEGETAHD